MEFRNELDENKRKIQASNFHVGGLYEMFAVLMLFLHYPDQTW